MTHPIIVRGRRQIDAIIAQWQEMHTEGISTAEIARRLGVPPSSLYKWRAARGLIPLREYEVVPICGEIRTVVTPAGVHITCTTCGRERLLTPRRAHSWLTIHRRGCTPRMVKRRIRKAA